MLANLTTTNSVSQKQANKKNRFGPYEAQLAQMLKFVFFENKQAQGIPMEQLMKDLSQLEK